MVCSCYWPFFFNQLKCHPLPTPAVGLHKSTPITAVIIGGIPPGGIFWEKNPGLTSTHYCIKVMSTFPHSFPHIHALGGVYGLHNNNAVYISYTQLHIVNQFSRLHNFHFFPSIHLIFSSPMQSPSSPYIIFKTTFLLHLIPYLLLYYIVYHITSICLIY